MCNEDFLAPIKKLNNSALQSAVNNIVPEKESGSIFNNTQTTNKDNLVPIKDVNEEEKRELTAIIQNTIDNISKMADYSILSQEDSKYTVNGEIDQDFQQGNVADCVLLAGMYSLAQSEAGKEIIKNAIKINYDENWDTESYEVYFKGLDKTYTIPVEEYKEAERLRLQYQRGEVEQYYSAGDDDMLLMELAYKAAFDDINEAKRSSGLFAKTDALTNIDYEQFLYAFVGTEDINETVYIEDKYRENQIEQYAPKIKEAFEIQEEFKLEDVCPPNVQVGGIIINSFEFDFDSTYVIDKKPSESEDGEITIRNKKTGEILTYDAKYLTEYFASILTEENKKQVGAEMYDLAMNSDFVYFGNASHEPVEVTDIDGKSWTIFQQHAYGVKEITEDYIILINPHNSTEEIKMPKEEYLKNYNTLGGFTLFSADFEE